MNFRLKHLLAVAFTVIATVPVLILAVWVERTAFEKELASVHDKHLLLAKNLTAALDRYAHDAEAVFRFLVRTKSDGDLHSRGTAELAGAIGIVQFQVLDRTARVIRELTDTPVSRPSLNARQLDPLLADAGSAPRFSGVVPDANGNPTIFLYQLLGKDRIAIGALGTDYFVKLQQTITFGRKGHAAIVDQHGAVIAHPNADWRWAMKNISKVEPVRKMMAGQSGVTQFYSPAVKKQMISGFTTAARTGWGVMVPQPLNELIDKARDVNTVALGIALIGVAAAAIMSWILAGFLTGPLVAVVGAARDIANGRLAATVPEKSRSMTAEFRELAVNFNRMAERVQSNEKSLIDALKKTEDTDRAKSQFLANISHELRTPLNAIIGFSDAMQRAVLGPIGNERYSDYAAHINESGTHLLSIINNILDISKIEAGKIEIEEDVLQLPALVDAAIMLVGEQADRNGIRLMCDIPNGLPEIRGSETMLKQVLVNLLANSVKFTAAQGQVTVTAELEAAGGVAVAVADTGFGMSEDDIAVAFEPFGQADSQISRRAEGAGLGLPLAQGFMELHAGTISIDSTLGRGTTVTIRLPADRVMAQSA